MAYYEGTQPARYIWANKRYLPIPHLYQHITPTHYVTVIPTTPNGATTYSIAPIKRIMLPNQATDPGHQLMDLGRPDLLKTMDMGEDTSWVMEAIHTGSLITCHDGSYMPKLAPDICSAALVVSCSKTKCVGTWTVVEKTTASTASNYRGEILGAILNGLLLWGECRNTQTKIPPIATGCDNMGVIRQARSWSNSLPERQPQADVLRCLRNLLSNLPVVVH